MVKTKIRLGINHIAKVDFLEAYLSARIEAFKPETIKKSFGAAGLVPFPPDRVISKLDIRLRTPTPPSNRSNEWELKTSSNYTQLLKQASSIKALLRTRSRSTPSSVNSAINQALKACQITLQSLAFLEKEIRDLRAANEKQKQKRTRSTRQIAHEGDFSVQEVRELQSDPIESQIARITQAREQIRGLHSPVRGPYQSVAYVEPRAIREIYVQIDLIW